MHELIKNSKILIIDDNLETLSLLGKIFSEFELSVLIADTADKGINIAITKMPDIILLDITMPDMNGLEVCNILKTKDETKAIPIVFITGKTEQEDIIKGFKAGSVDYIVKPFSKDELIARVFTHLKTVKMQEQLLTIKELVHQKEIELINNSKLFLERELDNAQKDISMLTLQLGRIANITKKLSEEILSKCKKLNDDFCHEIHLILNSYLMNLEQDFWKEIEIRFLKVHQDFNKKLLLKYPTLTNNELRLCTFIRLNLSTKQIASITMQQEEAINKARYRLRKKLLADFESKLHNLIMEI